MYYEWCFSTKGGEWKGRKDRREKGRDQSGGKEPCRDKILEDLGEGELSEQARLGTQVGTAIGRHLVSLLSHKMVLVKEPADPFVFATANGE